VHEALQEPLGVELSGIGLGELDDTQVARIQLLLAQHGVVVMRAQHDVDDQQFTAFLRRFGELVFTVGETPVPGHPDLNLISNVGRDTPPRSQFHVDTSYVSAPPAYTALRAVTVPAEGGETLFSNQYRAHDTLPTVVRERLVGRTIKHRVTGLQPTAGGESSARHPVFRRHPLSRRTGLYLSTPQRCVSISGFGEDEAAEMIAYLYAHSTRDDNVVRHAWAPGDVVIWDNGCVMHRADHSAVVGDRVMHRGMSRGYA
jgi:taurine dioxygenase